MVRLRHYVGFMFIYTAAVHADAIVIVVVVDIVSWLYRRWDLFLKEVRLAFISLTSWRLRRLVFLRLELLVQRVQLLKDTVRIIG
jgi:hypothetical protein